MQVKDLRGKCEALAAKKRFLTHQAQESEKTAEAAVAAAAAADKRAAADNKRAEAGGNATGAATVAGGAEAAAAGEGAAAAGGASRSGGSCGEIEPASPARLPAAAGAEAATGLSGGNDSDEDELLDCAICRSRLSDEIQVFPCGHYFCAECAAHTLSQPSPSCPCCRQKCTDKNTFRVAMAPAGGVHDAEVDPPEGPQVRKMQVRGAGGGGPFTLMG